MSGGDCIFCRIAAGEIPCRKVYEDGDLIAFHEPLREQRVGVRADVLERVVSVPDTIDTDLLALDLCRKRKIVADVASGSRYVPLRRHVSLALLSVDSSPDQ